MIELIDARLNGYIIYIHYFIGMRAAIIYINQMQMGGEPQKQDTLANKRTPLLREEVPYQITLIRLRQWQGSCRVPQNK